MSRPAVSPPDSPTALFDLAVVPDRDRVHLRPRGELDLTTSPELESTARALLDRGFGRVVIDLRGLTFIDCSGIHALVNVDRHGRALRRRVSIVPGEPAIQRVLELTGVAGHLRCEPSPRPPAERLAELLACEAPAGAGMSIRRRRVSRRPGHDDGCEPGGGGRSRP